MLAMQLPRIASLAMLYISKTAQSAAEGEQWTQRPPRQNDHLLALRTRTWPTTSHHPLHLAVEKHCIEFVNQLGRYNYYGPGWRHSPVQSCCLWTLASPCLDRDPVRHRRMSLYTVLEVVVGGAAPFVVAAHTLVFSLLCSLNQLTS